MEFGHYLLFTLEYEGISRFSKVNRVVLFTLHPDYWFSLNGPSPSAMLECLDHIFNFSAAHLHQRPIGHDSLVIRPAELGMHLG